MIQTGFESRVKIQQILSNQFPDYIKAESPKAIDFLKQYYISQEYQGGNADIINNLDQYLKVDNLTPEVVVGFTTLSAGIGSTDSTIQVSSTKGFPKNYGLLKINDEIITYTGISDDATSFTGCIRGFSGITSYHAELKPQELVFSSSESSSHLSNSNIENLSSLFLKEFYKKQKYTFTPGLEDVDFSPEVNAGNFIKEAKSLYESKGTDESFKLLFNALYAETPKIINLEEYLIKPSSANYVRRQVLIAEPISGDPTKLIGQTLYKLNDLDTNASISEVEPFTRVSIAATQPKLYYKISLFLGYDDSTPTIQGNFTITPTSKAIQTVGIGNSIITVDSTVGFGTTGTLSVGINTNINYTHKSVNQFYGCSGIDDAEISPEDVVRNQDIYFGYEDGDFSKDPVQLRINGVVSKFEQISKSIDVDEGQIIAVKNVGDLIENPPEDRTYKEIFGNSWIYNTSVRFQIQDNTTQDGFDANNVILYQNIDRSSLKLGDGVGIYRRSSNTDISDGKVKVTSLNQDPAKWWRTKTKELKVGVTDPLDFTGEFDIRRKLSLPVSIGASLADSNFISDVQNVYIDNTNKEFYVASNSLPSGSKEIGNRFAYDIFTNVLSDSSSNLVDVITSVAGINTDYKYGAVQFTNNVPFIDGDQVNYNVYGNLPYLGLEDGGIYYVGIASGFSNNTIRIYNSRSLIDTENYIKLETQSGNPFETGHTFTLGSQKSRVISAKNTFRRFPFIPSNNRGEQTKTKEGSTGILINGVEIINYKSNDKIYYGPLESIDVLNSGEDYDVINVPYISVNVGIGTTALIQPVVKGSITKVTVDAQGFDINNIVSVSAIGGGKGGAVLEPIIASKSRNVLFNGALDISSGGGINTSLNTIHFITDHGFRNEQEIIYKSNNQDGIGVGIGTSTLVNNSTYFPHVLNNTTIQLYGSVENALSGINTINFNGTNCSGVHEFVTLPTSKSLTAISVVDGGTFTNRKLIVNYSGISTQYSTVNFKNHGFDEGDTVVYTNTAGAGVTVGDIIPVSGLNTTNQYKVVKIDNDSFYLTDVGIGGTNIENYQIKNYVSLNSTGAGYHNFAYPDISVSVKYSPVGFGTTTQETEEITLTPTIRGNIVDAYLYESGIGYGSTILNFHKKPLISIKNGKDAGIEPIIINGRITGVNLQFGGSEYYSTPSIEITDSSGKGSGAELRPIIVNQKIASVEVINTGIGYSATDTSINVVSAGKNALIGSNVRSLTVNIREKYGSDEILIDNGNTLNYSVCGYANTIRHAFGENVSSGSTQASKIIGWAYDGNPIYGPYAYSNPSIEDNARSMVSGYTLSSNVVDRPSGFDLGYFVDDYEFTNSGDLDRNNGRFGKTPEFPNGVYAYYATIDTTGISTQPVFPYFIGDSYRASELNQEISQDFDFKNSDLMRNTFPYRVSEKYADNDFIIEPNEIENQKIEVESVTSGSITKLNVIDSGEDYKINDILNFNNENTDGSGLSGKVVSIKGKTIDKVSTASSIYQNAIFTWDGNKGTKVTVLPNHNWKTGDNIIVSGLSTTLSDLNGPYKIGVTSITSTLIRPMTPASVGVVTEIYISNIPNNISIGSSVKVESELVKLLNVYEDEKILRVMRNTSGVAHTSTTLLTFTPDSFNINKVTEQYDSELNQKFYFNPFLSVGFGTESGVTSTTTYTFGDTEITQKIPSKSIWAPRHKFKENDEVTFSKSPDGGSDITISDGSFTTQYNLPSTVYISNLTPNTIGIKTGIGTTSGEFTDVFFRGGGSNKYDYLLESNPTKETGRVQKLDATVSVSTYHNLQINDIITLDIKPKLSVGVGTGTTVAVTRNTNDGFILVDRFVFGENNVSSSTSTITITGHKFITGDKIYFEKSTSSPIAEGSYYVYVIDDDNFNLCKTYSNATQNPPIIVTWSGSPAIVYAMAKVNPQIEVVKNNSLVFNLDDSSLLNYKLKFYYDDEFKNEFVSTATTTFNILNEGTIGDGSTGKSTISFNDQSPNVLYYSLERSGFISTSDTTVVNGSQIKFIDSKYNEDYNVTGIADTSFNISLKQNPEKLTYLPTECDSITYKTSSLYAKGGISNVQIVSGGSGYKKLPTFVGSSSTEGNGGYVVSESDEVGDINKIRVINEGFEFSVDNTLEPTAYISPSIVIKDSNKLGVVTVTDGGSGYIKQPNAVIVNSTTGNKINSGFIEVSMVGNAIANINVVRQPSGLPDIPAKIFTTNNSNGVGIKTIMSNNSGIFTCYINTPSIGFNVLPFTVNDDVYVEGIVSIGNSGSGFNSEDNGFNFAKVKEYDTSGLDHKVVVDYTGISTNVGLAVTDQASLASLINKNKYPQFSITQVSDSFIIGEKIIRDSITLDLIITKSDSDFIKILGTDTLFVGDIITGRESGTKATIASISDNYGKYEIQYSVQKNIGWYDNVGKLSEDDQVTPNNDYYQNLSYSIQSSKQFQELRNPVISLLHTSGLKNFADTVISSSSIIETNSSDSSISIRDVITDNRVDTVYNYDFGFDLLESAGASSKFIRLKTKKLSDYIVCESNQVLVVDDISNQFSNLEGEPSDFLNILKVDSNNTYENIFIKVSNLTKTDTQVSELTLLNNGTNISLLENKFLPDDQNIGTFSLIKDQLGDSYIRFIPLPNAFDYDYDLKSINTKYLSDVVGVGTESIGFVDMTGYIGVAPGITNTGLTTTTIHSVDKTQYNSFHVKNQITNLTTNDMEYVELYVTHDGSETYISEYFADNTGFSNEASIGSFKGNIDGSILSLNFENSLSNDIMIKSDIVGFGLTSVGIGTYRFGITNQPDGAERSALYQSTYSNQTASEINVSGLSSSLFDASRSVVQVSAGSTRALHQVIMNHNTTDIYIQQAPFISAGSTSEYDSRLGIGTFGGVFDNDDFKLKFYPNSEFTSSAVEVAAFTLGVYSDFDVVNSDDIQDLNIGTLNQSVNLFQYNALNGDRINRTSFKLTSEKTPIFGKVFDPTNTNILNLNTGKFNIKDHFFRTGEELVYNPYSTFVGVGSTPMQYQSAQGIDTLPASVFAIREDADNFYIATTRALANAGTGVTFVGVGTGNAHKLSMDKANTKAIIGINNIIQSPLSFSPVNHSLQNNIESVIGSTGIGTTSTVFSLSGISSFRSEDIIKVDDEYMKILNVGMGDDVFGPITGIGTTSLVEVERGFVGTAATAHTNTTIARLYKGSYHFIEDEIHFVESPRGNPQATKTINDLEFPTSKFTGRAFLRNNYDTNQIYDDISQEFTGIQTSFTLRVGGANTVGLGTTGGNGLLLINNIYQTPTADNNPSNNFAIIEQTSPSGITSVQFTGIKTTTDSTIVISESDINQNQIPRGGVIISLGSTPGMGYAPPVGAIAYPLTGIGGTLSSIVSVASTGVSNSITTASYDNVTGLLNITTQNPHNFELGIVKQVKLSRLEFACANEHAGVTTSFFPEAAIGSGSTDLSYPVLSVIKGDYKHSFISADNDAVNVTSGSENGNQKTPNEATYNPTSGLLELSFSNVHGMSTGDTITLDNNSLTFTCDRDNYTTQHEYPRSSDPISGVTTAIVVTSTKSFSINVGASPTYRFTTNVGICTIPHNYVGGGDVVPYYSDAFYGSGYTGSTVSIGVTDTPFDHKFVSSSNNSIHKTNWSGTTLTPESATYSPISGDLTLVASSHGLTDSDVVGIVTNSLMFTCSKDDYNSEHPYPRESDPVSGILTAVTSYTSNTFTVNVGSSVGSGGAVSATVGAGGTLTFSITGIGTNYNNPELVVPVPSYAGLGITGISRLDQGTTTDCGVGLLLNVEVGACSTVGVGSTLFGINKWEIQRNGYSFRKGDVFKIVGLVTDRSLTNPLHEGEFTVVDTFTDNFTAWQFGEFDYIDSIKNLQDGSRTRFELKYDNELLSFDNIGVGATTNYNVSLSNALVIFINGVLQEAGTAYEFEGGTSFAFLEPPHPEDNVAIFFYRGSPGEDTTLVTDVIPSIEEGDLLQLEGTKTIETQDNRTIYDLKSSDIVETNLYTDVGISTQGVERPLNWSKQRSDKIIDGKIITKTRGSSEPLIFPTAKIISNLSSTETFEIFVDNINLFGYDAPFFQNYNAFVVDNNTNPVAASLTATVSNTGTISAINIVSGGGGYVGSAVTLSIGIPTVGIGTYLEVDGTVGIGSTALASATITNGEITNTTVNYAGSGYTSTNVPQVLSPLPQFNHELIRDLDTVTGWTGIITGIGTTVGVGTDLGIVFHTRSSNYNSLNVGYPICVFDTNVGTGLTSIYESGSGVVGIGTSFANNIYKIAQISTPGGGTLGVITCNIAYDTTVSGLAVTGTEYSPAGKFSLGRLSGTISRSSNPVSIGVSGLTINSGLTTFPTIIRRDEGYRNSGAISPT